MANLQIKIDRIAVWREAANLKEGDINVIKNPAGIRYLERGSNIYKISTEPMFRYVKNYHIGTVKFSLFVRSFIENTPSIGEQLDAAALTITEEYARHIITDPDTMYFEYLDRFVEKDYLVREAEEVVSEPEPEEEE